MSANINTNDLRESRAIRLKILDKEVQIGCKPGEEDDLAQAAAMIDQGMRELRQRNSTASVEKIAIVTAINTASALLKSRTQNSDETSLTRRMASMNQTLESLLSEPDKTEAT